MMKTAFPSKNFNLSQNWHKVSHVMAILRWLGPFIGGMYDQHGERRQRLAHVAWRRFSSRVGGKSIAAIASYFVRWQALQHVERWIATCNSDLVLAAEKGILADVEFLLEGRCDALAKDRRTGRRPASDALEAAATRGRTSIVRCLLDAKVAPACTTVVPACFSLTRCICAVAGRCEWKER